jgi:WXG100 family type VII secretion target
MAVSMTTETLAAAARRCEEAEKFIRNEMKKVDSERSSALAGWAGPAAQAFDRLVNAWQDEATKMVQTIEQFHGQLSSTASENVQMEDEQQSMLDKFAGQMGV